MPAERRAIFCLFIGSPDAQRSIRPSLRHDYIGLCCELAWASLIDRNGNKEPYGPRVDTAARMPEQIVLSAVS